MQYVIKDNCGNYYTGPDKDYVYRMGYWSFYLNNATVFSDLPAAKDILNSLNKTYPHSIFLIFEYHPATIGKAILSEKEQLLRDLEEINNRINSGTMTWGQVTQEIFPTIKSAIKFIKESVND